METEVQNAEQQAGESLEAVVAETTAEVKNAESSEAEAAKGKKYKQSASERIRQLNEQKKQAEAKALDAETKMAEAKQVFESEIRELKNALKEINERLKAGEITKAQAEQAKSQAKFEFDASLDDVEISDDIKPYKDDIVKIAQKIAKSMLAPYEQKISEYESERARLYQDRLAQEKEQHLAQLRNAYLTAAKEFPDIFEEVSEEGELPELKPEYDEKARQIAALFNMPYQDENGVTINYNPLLSSVDGLRLIFSYVSRQSSRAGTAQKAKAEINKVLNNVADAKKSKVETPYSPSHSASKKETLHDIVSSTMKELGM